MNKSSINKLASYIFLALVFMVLLASCKNITDDASDITDASDTIKTWVVSTLAGEVTENHDDGADIKAEFSYPSGVAVDLDGNVYVADSFNHRIQKIAAGGKIITLGGKKAKFSYPSGVAVDLDGNVYVADSFNHRIRKITTAGEMSTFAGTGDAGFRDHVFGKKAKFDYPLGVAVDLDGNVYVADTVNYRIRKITVAGVVSTIAGSSAGYENGIGTEAKFRYPGGVAVDLSGNIYVADEDNHLIRKIEYREL